ncbi:hypothetical protein J5N97_030108 [Dioscorea zingiberensis]|uniref:DUF4378 domain-containing protein n=1 Tax=Dioscorea zingiberensis TaxID=325984 RepID=A0A9D5H3R3_9LILI|nr:hypothetical protein J5N97_030108 [Dioscorea zingiberensis]
MERSGSRGRERSQYAGTGAARKGISSPVPKPVGRGLDRGIVEGNGHSRKRIYSSKMAVDSNSGSNFPVEKNSIALKYKQNPHKEVSGTPIKALINEEMSKELETKRPSPSLIARLMGLDSLPSAKVVNKPLDALGSCFPHGSSTEYQGKHVPCEEHSFRKPIDENQDFKDVFEIVEMEKSEESKNQLVRKGISSSKRSETDVAFIKQKFMDAKRFSTNETLQKSKEFDDALEILDSNKDLFLKFLQEPNSLFSKHIQGLNCGPPPPHASHITILKSGKGTKHRSNEVCLQSEINTVRCAHMQKDVAYFRRPGTGLVDDSIRGHCSPRAHKLSKSDYLGRNDAFSHPTRIVVLKPSLEMAQNKGRKVPMPRSTEDIEFGYNRHRDTQRLGIQELHAEGRARKKSSDNVEVMGHRIKGSREIAREITEQMRHSMSNGRKNVSNSRFDSNKRWERSCNRSETLKPKAYQWSPSHFHYMDNDSSSSSSYYSTETSVSREARKRLSERWKIAKRSQELGVVDKTSGTLGEMLALSDKEMASKPRFIIQRDKKPAKCEAIERHGCPLGISSKDGWKEGRSRKLERSISLPTSTAYGIPKLRARQKAAGHDNCYMLKDVLNLESDDPSEENINQRGLSHRRRLKHRRNKPPHLDCGVEKEENALSEKEIHVNLELPKNNVDATLLSEPSEDKVHVKGYLVDDFLFPQANSSSSVANEEQMNKSTLCEVLSEDGELSGLDQNNIKIQETSYHQAEPILPSDCNLTESGSPVSSNEAGQPSPVSVLEHPSEEISSSGCFESVSADLKELRMQLRLLKMESSDAYAEESEIDLGDEDDGRCHPLTETREILLAFKGEDDRDFSYLLDVLNDFGVHGPDWDSLSDPFYMREHPVCPSMFGKLEKKYSIDESWSRSERKRLFDLINLVLVEIVQPFKDLVHPWVKPRRVMVPMCSPDCLVDKVWQMVVKNRKESEGKLDRVLELKWLDLVEDIDLVGIELETTLTNELLEEFISDMMLAG